MSKLSDQQAPAAAPRERTDELVHDLRVAARRCQSVAIALAPYLPDNWPRKISRTLKPLRKACDQVRDLDVLQVWLTGLGQPKLITAGLLEGMRNRREAAMRQMTDTLGHHACRKQLRQLVVFLQEPLKKSARPNYRLIDIAAAVLTARAAEITVFHQTIDQAVNPDAAQSDLHRLRIAGKDFRYTLEMLQSSLNDNSQIIKNQFTQFQDSLGALHDRIRFAQLLYELAEENQLPQDVLIGLDSELSREKQTGWQAFFDQWQKMTPWHLTDLILMSITDREVNA